MKLNLLAASIIIVLTVAWAHADYTCSTNPNVQYAISVQADPTSQAGYSATVNDVTFKEVSAIFIGDLIDFNSADGHFNLWISDQPGITGAGLQSTLSAFLMMDSQNHAINLQSIDATCTGSIDLME
jgi:hypothetical protein